MADGPMLQEGTWIMSWNWMAGCKPTKHSGILKTKTGFRVRVRATDPRAGTLKEVNREFEGITADEANMDSMLWSSCGPQVARLGLADARAPPEVGIDVE